MPDTNTNLPHPFADLIELTTRQLPEGDFISELVIQDKHMNPHGVVHGGVIYALIDTGMGGALTSRLSETEICSTIEIKVNYLRPALKGKLSCKSRVVNKGRRTSVLESEVFDEQDRPVSCALGTFMIIERPAPA